VLEQHQPDHEASCNPGPALVAVKRSDLPVEVLPIDPAGERDQLVLHVDDLIEPGPEQIVFPSRLVLFRPHRPLRCSTESLFEPKGNPKMKLQGSRPSSPKTLQSQNRLQPRKRLPVSRLVIVHGQLQRRTISATCSARWARARVVPPGSRRRSPPIGRRSPKGPDGARRSNGPAAPAVRVSRLWCWPNGLMMNAWHGRHFHKSSLLLRWRATAVTIHTLHISRHNCQKPEPWSND